MKTHDTIECILYVITPVNALYVMPYWNPES